MEACRAGMRRRDLRREDREASGWLEQVDHVALSCLPARALNKALRRWIEPLRLWQQELGNQQALTGLTRKKSTPPACDRRYGPIHPTQGQSVALHQAGARETQPRVGDRLLSPGSGTMLDGDEPAPDPIGQRGTPPREAIWQPVACEQKSNRG